MQQNPQRVNRGELELARRPSCMETFMATLSQQFNVWLKVLEKLFAQIMIRCYLKLFQ
jgi:hypothetical protein